MHINIENINILKLSVLAIFTGTNCGFPSDHAFIKHAPDAICPPPTGIQCGGLFISGIRLSSRSSIYGRRVCWHSKGTNMFERLWARSLAGDFSLVHRCHTWTLLNLVISSSHSGVLFLCKRTWQQYSGLNVTLIPVLSSQLLPNLSCLMCTFQNLSSLSLTRSFSLQVSWSHVGFGYFYTYCNPENKIIQMVLNWALSVDCLFPPHVLPLHKDKLSFRSVEHLFYPGLDLHTGDKFLLGHYTKVAFRKWKVTASLI